MTDIDKVEKDIIRKITKVDNLFKIPSSENMELIFDINKNEIEEPFEKEIKERSQLMKIFEEDSNKDKIFKLLKTQLPGKIDILFKIFTKNEKFKIINNNNIDNIIYENILFENFKTSKINKYLELSDNKDKYFKNIIMNIMEYIKQMFIHLKKNGSCVFTLAIPNYYVINILYFLSTLFEEIFILNKYIIFCKNFKKHEYQMNNIKKIEKYNYNFDIKPKKKYNKMIKYFKDLIKIDLYYKKLLFVNHKFNNYILYKYSSDLYLFIYLYSKYYKNSKNYNLDSINKMKIFLQKLFKENFKNDYFIKNIFLNDNVQNDIYLNELLKIKNSKNK